MPTDTDCLGAARARRPALALLLCAVGATAWAEEPNPYWIGAYQLLTHDSNLLRAPEAQAESDTVSDTGLRLGLDQPMGRHRLHGSLGLDALRYSRKDQLNHTAYRADAGLDWTAAEHWSGELGAEATRQIFRYDLSTSTRSDDLTLQTERRSFARARLGAVTRWTLELEAEAFDRSFSNALYEGRDLARHFVGAGLRFQPGPDLQLRAMARTGGGRYPHLGNGDTFDRDELRLSAWWRVGGATTVDSFVSRSRERHELQTARSTSYWLGSFRWRWEPSPKSAWSLRVLRDSDAGSSELGAVSADARLTTTAEGSFQWLPTAKLQVDLSAKQSERQLDSTFVVLSGTALHARDVSNALSLGVTYRPWTSVDLGCTLSRERRSVPEGADTGLSYAFRATTLGCSAQYLWR